jgi:hypothetical protein
VRCKVRLDQGHKHPGVDLDQRCPPRAPAVQGQVVAMRPTTLSVVVFAFGVRLLRMYDDGDTGCAKHLARRPIAGRCGLGILPTRRFSHATASMGERCGGGERIGGLPRSCLSIRRYPAGQFADARGHLCLPRKLLAERRPTFCCFCTVCTIRVTGGECSMQHTCKRSTAVLYCAASRYRGRDAGGSDRAR